MKFFIQIIILFLTGQAVFASQTINIDVSCPSGAEGYIDFKYMASSNVAKDTLIAAMTNLETRQGIFQEYKNEMLLKARCSLLEPLTSPLSFTVDYNGEIQYTADWVNFDTLATVSLAMFAFGILLAFAFIGGVKSAEK